MNKISPLSNNQYAYLQRSFHSWLNVAEGGKRGGKNVLNTLAFALSLEEHPDKLHLIAGVTVAAAKLNVIDCDGYGLANYFDGRCREGEYKKRDALFISTRTGEKIVLISGVGKDGEERKIKGNSYGMVYITEVNECHPNGIQECFDRTLASKDRKIFHDLNPKAEGHFYYTDILNFHEEKQKDNPDYGLNYGHFTIADNLSMTQKQVDEAINTYDHKSVWFFRDILGNRKQTEGLVYSNFNADLHVVKSEPRNYTKYQVSIDYGTFNPFCGLLWGLSNGVWYCVKEYWHNGRDNAGQKDDGQYYDDLLKFIGNIKIDRMLVDPSASSFITHARHRGNFDVIHAKNDVLDGIRSTQTALNKGLIKINDCCKNLIKEFGLYSWNEKAEQDEPIKENDHAMDACRYFVFTNKIAIPERDRR